MPSAKEVRGSDRRYVEWWFRARAGGSAIAVGALGAPLLLWIGIDEAAPWLFLLAALCLLLVVYGAWSIRHLGPVPDKRAGYQPRG